MRVIKIHKVPHAQGRTDQRTGKRTSYYLFFLSTGQIVYRSQLSKLSGVNYQTISSMVRKLGWYHEKLLLPISDFRPGKNRGNDTKKKKEKLNFDRGRVCIKNGHECKDYGKCQDDRLFYPNKFKEWYSQGNCKYVPAKRTYIRGKISAAVPNSGRIAPKPSAE